MALLGATTDLERVGDEAKKIELYARERLDPDAAAALVRRDMEVNQSFCNVLAQLARFMVEDPRAISACVDVLFVAKSLERIGDHAKNIRFC